jgi:transcriptional regulator with XRE-family HTH domain
MHIDDLLTDDAILAELGQRLARTRLARNMTQRQLAEEAGVAERTVARVESGASTTLTNLVRLLRALDLSGGLDRLVPEPGPNPILELELRGRERRRARPRPAADPPPQASGSGGGWVWGDERGDDAA